MSMPGPVANYLHHGKTLHLNHGPIDLIICCEGSPEAIVLAYRQAQHVFTPLLNDLVGELPLLREPINADIAEVQGPVARRMQTACRPYAACDVTAMAAVAGAVADHMLTAIKSIAGISRAWVNNGGDIAVYLTAGQVFECGVVGGALQHACSVGKIVIRAADGIGGIATSGQAMSLQGGRSFSMGIADSVTVLAQHAAAADVAATLIANTVDLPGHAAIKRTPADELDPDSDLRRKLVTVSVGELHEHEILSALQRGAKTAHYFVSLGLIEQAFLTLRGQSLQVAGPKSKHRLVQSDQLMRHSNASVEFCQSV